MEAASYHPGKISIAFAILFAFLSTTNGRNMAAEILHRHVKQTIMFKVPIRLRCALVQYILSMPVNTGRKVLKEATKPWGAQHDYITRVEKNGVLGHWIIHGSDKNNKVQRVQWAENTAKEADLVIYYIHGGGFRIGHSVMYMDSFMHIIHHLKKTRNMNVCIFSIDYGMSPEVQYSQSQQDCMDGYRYLLNNNISAKKIVFAGDSAGGNLVSSCVLRIRDENEIPQPAGNVVISPWIIVENSKSTRPGKQYLDCLNFEMLHARTHDPYFIGSKEFANEEERLTALRNPAISPVNASFVGVCPTLVAYGGTEIFQHDVEDLIKVLKRDGVEYAVITNNAPHIYLISSFLSPTYKLWKEDCTRLADWCANVV